MTDDVLNVAARNTLAKLEKKDPDWRKTALALYDQGASDREVMKELALSPGSWEVLYNDVLESDFRELVDFGRLLSHAWWESQGRINLRNKQFNAALWTINMKNRFGWSEKTEQSMTNLDYGNMDSDTLLKEIKELNARLGLGRGKGTI